MNKFQRLILGFLVFFIILSFLLDFTGTALNQLRQYNTDYSRIKAAESRNKVLVEENRKIVEKMTQLEEQNKALVEQKFLLEESLKDKEILGLEQTLQNSSPSSK